jgi:hypothetical protein
MNIILRFGLIVLLLFACKENIESTKKTEFTEIPPKKQEKTEKSTKNLQKNMKTDFCWKGKIQGKIPVFLHFQVEDSILVGEIKYLNTKQKLPIKLIGQQMAGGLFRILEFEKSGNVSGIITGVIHGKEFNGEWFSPKSRKDLPISLTHNDTIIPSIDFAAKTEDCYGEYRYQYSEEGATGGFTLIQKDQKSLFDIGCFTSAPAHNMAIIEQTEVKLANKQINFQISEEETCNFQVKFYDGFAIVRYTNGDCTIGYFGHNAHLEGIFLKIK